MSFRLTDPQQAPQYAPTRLQRALERCIHDPRDVVFLRLTLKATLVIGPLMALLYWRFSWWLAALFAFIQLPLLAPPVILMLHNTMHRPFLRGPRWLGRAHSYLMSALFGLPTGYMEHHLGMHHVENNLPTDLSSTMRYRRDSLLHWLAYLARFLFGIHVELTRYLASRGRGAMGTRALVADLVHMSLIVGLFVVNWRATLVAFAGPYVVTRFMMMLGNWGQHAFIDAARPGHSYVNSISCVNSKVNHSCFNDGYHIGHHVKPNRHWTELPQDLLNNQARYRREGCLVFENLDFALVAVLLFLKRYDFLAKRVVRLDGDARSDAEIAALLRARTRPILQASPSLRS